MKRTTTRALALLVAIVTIAAAYGASGPSFGAGSTAAVSQHRAHARHRHVSFASPNSSTPTLLAANCDPSQPAVCLLPLNLDPQPVTGDLTGSSVTSGVTTERLGKYPSVSLVAFTGGVKGCGTGSLLIVVNATLDPATSSTRGSWAVSGRQGTGDLFKVTGGGIVVGDATAFHFHGRIRCR